VTITCYNKTRKLTRRSALKYFMQGMQCSDGSEHDRYETIFFQLLEGNMVCSDRLTF
jgi:hypothetical protein